MGQARKCNCEDNISDHYTGTVPEKVPPWQRRMQLVCKKASCQPGEGAGTLPAAGRTARPSQVSLLGVKRGLVNHKSCIFPNVGSLVFKLPAMKKVCSLFNRKLTRENKRMRAADHCSSSFSSEEGESNTENKRQGVLCAWQVKVLNLHLFFLMDESMGASEISPNTNKPNSN